MNRCVCYKRKAPRIYTLRKTQRTSFSDSGRSGGNVADDKKKQNNNWDTAVRDSGVPVVCGGFKTGQSSDILHFRRTAAVTGTETRSTAVKKKKKKRHLLVRSNVVKAAELWFDLGLIQPEYNWTNRRGARRSWRRGLAVTGTGS